MNIFKEVVDELIIIVQKINKYKTQIEDKCVAIYKLKQKAKKYIYIFACKSTSALNREREALLV